jgi:hypothetical protein
VRLPMRLQLAIGALDDITGAVGEVRDAGVRRAEAASVPTVSLVATNRQVSITVTTPVSSGLTYRAQSSGWVASPGLRANGSLKAGGSGCVTVWCPSWAGSGSLGAAARQGLRPWTVSR